MGLPSEGRTLLVVVTVFWCLALIAVALRVWARLIKRQPIVFNDYAAFVALLFASGVAICNIVAVSMGGIGQHMAPPQVTFNEELVDLKTYTVVWFLQAMANSWVRISFLDLLRRIFRTPVFVKLCWVVMGLAIAYMVGCFITFFAICRPFAYNWDPNIQGTCGNMYLSFLLSAIFNLVLDWTIIMLPLPVLWHLQMKTQKKVALTFVFTIGLV